LANVEPDDVVHERRERGIRLAFDGGADDAFDAGCSREARKIQRQRAAAGDEADGFGRKMHAIWTGSIAIKWRESSREFCRQGLSNFLRRVSI